MCTWKDLSLKWKLVFFGLLSVLIMAGGAIISNVMVYEDTRATSDHYLSESVREQIVRGLKEKTEIACAVVDQHYKLADGKPLEQAQAAAI